MTENANLPAPVVAVLIPTETEGVYTTQVFADKASVRKAFDLSKLPTGTIILRGRPIIPQVKQIVTI